MYKKVLAAVNEHVNSEVAARYALGLAKAAGAKLYLAYVCEKKAPKYDIERAEDAMKRLFKDAVGAGVEAESISECGDPVKTIKQIVKSEGIGIAFAATRSEDVKRRLRRLSRLYAGTMARRLSLGLPCSVALVRVIHMGKIRPKEILVPLKGRIAHMEERAYFTAMLAKAFDAKVYVFHTAKPVTSFFHGELHLKPAEWEGRLPPDISVFMGRLEKLGASHEKRLAPGKPSRSITVEAAQKRSDLIVMGASERSLLSSLIKGNPVERVLRETPCDLIILRPRHE